MRLKLFLAANLLQAACFACSYETYTPEHCSLYRIIETPAPFPYESFYWTEARQYLQQNFNFEEENLQLWRQQTGTTLCDNCLRDVVYGTKDISYAFSDTAAVACLQTARTVARIRNAMADPWYFPASNRDGGEYTPSLEELAETCKEHAGGIFRGRYALLALRCLTSMRRWTEAIDFWEQQKPHLPADVIRTMAEREAAAAYFRSGDTAQAADIYARVGDIRSLRIVRGKGGGIDEMECIYEQQPNSPYFPEEIQIWLREIDREHRLAISNLTYSSKEPDFRAFLRLCQRVIREKKATNMAMWYYAAAATLDALEQPQEALSYISSGQNVCRDVFLQKSFRLLRMHIDAKTLPLTPGYERKLLSDLKWLCQQIDGGVTAEVREEMSELWNYKWHENSYYWNDAMRRILLSDLCPRLVRVGRTTRALQLANFADYYLLRKLDISTLLYNEWDRREEDTFLYQSDMFDLTNGLSADQLAAYARHIRQDKGALDRFLSSGSMEDDAFWSDIVGTHYIRENRYGEAVQWLSRLPKYYEQQTNIYRESPRYMLRDPFDLSFDEPNHRRRLLTSSENYKLRFARKMLDYESAMKHGSTADIRGEAKVYYAAGLRNQQDYCWALSGYGDSYYSTYDPWTYKDGYDPSYKAAVEQSHQLIEEGLAEITDDETKARLLHALQRFGEVMEKYPLTETAYYMRQHCDTWRDYVPVSVRKDLASQ